MSICDFEVIHTGTLVMNGPYLNADGPFVFRHDGFGLDKGNPNTIPTRSKIRRR